MQSQIRTIFIGSKVPVYNYSFIPKFEILEKLRKFLAVEGKESS